MSLINGVLQFFYDVAVHVDHNIYPPANIKECDRVTLQAEYHLKSTQLLPLTQLQNQPQADAISG